MMRILVLLANGFEDIEMVTSVDIWRRGKIEVTLAGIDNLEVTSGTGIKMIADIHIDEAIKNNYDLLFLPGGGGVKGLDESESVKKLVAQYVDSGKYVAAICAAPLILGKLGILDNRVYTCYPTFEKFAPDGKYKVTGVIQDGTVITGRGIGYVFDFAFYILELLQGKEIRVAVEEGTLIIESKKGLDY